MIRKRALGLSLVAIITLTLVAAGHPVIDSNPRPALAATEQITVPAEADTWVRSTNPDRNHGSHEFLNVDNDPEMTTYLRFDVPELNGTVLSATLELHAEARHREGFSVRAVDQNDWDEHAVTFDNAPDYRSEILARSGSYDANSTVHVDLTGAVTPGTRVSFALTSETRTRMKLSSRESGATAPRLVLVMSESGEPGEPHPEPTPDPTPVPDPADPDNISLELPIRATFYYPWFPNAWSQSGMEPFTQFDPELGQYDVRDPDVLQQHVEWMQYAGLDAAIASWWGIGHHTDDALRQMLETDVHDGFKWAIYHEQEARHAHSTSEIRRDLEHVINELVPTGNYLHVNGKPVVFVYNAGANSCDVANRWVPVAQELDVYLSLKVFSGYRDCDQQPDTWHQYGPAKAHSQHRDHHVNVSPGFWHAREGQPRLERNPERFAKHIRAMVTSGADWHLVTSFNEWGEGTIIEPAAEWGTLYLDILAADGYLEGTAPDPGPDPGDNREDGSPVTLVAASDIAYEGDADEKSAQMVDELLKEYPNLYIQTAGDNVQGDADWVEYDVWYRETWGRFFDRTRAAIGNHDYLDEGEGANYHRYFGDERGGPMDKFYYSYDLPNNWHVVVINSNNQLRGWEPGTEQYEWLEDVLEANRDKNVLAAWHHPRYTSGYTDDYDRMADIWDLLDEYNAEFVISGHTHLYERYLPQDGYGNVKEDGVVQFGVGTTTSPRRITSLDENADVVIERTQGLVVFHLYEDHYEWEFIPGDPDGQTDSGSAPVIP